MANFDDNRIVSRDPSESTLTKGYSPRLYNVPSKPPARWTRVNPETGLAEYYSLPSEMSSHGAMVSVSGIDGNGQAYNLLYVYIEQPTPSDPTVPVAWDPWKLVDLNWPKIDPRTGQPFDQYLEWYSPLAE